MRKAAAWAIMGAADALAVAAIGGAVRVSTRGGLAGDFAIGLGVVAAAAALAWASHELELERGSDAATA